MVIETVLYLEKGQKVRPFEEKTEFLPVEWNNLLDVNQRHDYARYEPVLTTNVEFEGIVGQVALMASSRIGTNKAETPLGEVKLEIEFTNGMAVVRQIPLSLRLDFELLSTNDWQRLLDNRAAFELGSKRYSPRYHLENFGKDTIQKLDQYKMMPAFGDILLSAETYKPTPVLLPYDLSRLCQGINLTMGSSS